MPKAVKSAPPMAKRPTARQPKAEKASAAPEQDKAPVPLGRPQEPFDQDIADHICDRLASEPVSITTICKDLGKSPATIFKWMNRVPAFEKQYARAKEAQVEALMEETMDIVDDGRNDYMMRLNHDGPEPGWHINGEALARSKMRVDHRKWLASKLKPKKYGDKIEVDQTIGVTSDFGGVLERIAQCGARLVPGMSVEQSIPKTDDPEERG